jgi:5-methyltetrahydropteroyltriglutamate--homocysteine methyltransferase
MIIPTEPIGSIPRPIAYIPVEQLGATDDCGFSPFSDTTTSRDTAVEKIRARVPGTELAAKIIGGCG